MKRVLLHIRKIIGPLAVFLWTCLVLMSLRIYSADVNFSRSRHYLSTGFVFEGCDYAQASSGTWSFNSLYVFNEGKCLAFLSSEGALETEQSVLYGQKAWNILDRAISSSPDSLRVIRDSLPSYHLLVIGPLDGLKYSSTEDLSYSDLLSQRLEEWKGAYFSEPGFLTEIYYYERELGLDEASLITFNRIRKIRPDLLQWHPLLLR